MKKTYTRSAEDVLQELGTSAEGLSAAEAQSRLEKYGPNKLKEAEKLLLTTDHSITEIAFEAGFSTVSHFIARFKAEKGITPHKLRMKLRS